MLSDKSSARHLTQVAIVSLLLIAGCWAQKPPQAQSAVPALPAEIPGTADRYSVLVMGNLAGQQALWTAPDGSLHIFYQFNDRGRGPKTTSILKLDAKGIPVAESVDGNDYLKSPVHESYTLESGNARWKNNFEEGEKKLTAPAVYVAINGAPAELGLLAQVALSNGGKVVLLPEGEAKNRPHHRTRPRSCRPEKTRHPVCHHRAGLLADLCLARRPPQFFAFVRLVEHRDSGGVGKQL